MSLVEYVVFAPLFEELAFRGLLFAILRRKFRFLPAALISAEHLRHCPWLWIGRLIECLLERRALGLDV